MTADREVLCARPGCGHGYGWHDPDDGCVLLEGTSRTPDGCPGFLWVPPVKPQEGEQR